MKERLTVQIRCFIGLPKVDCWMGDDIQTDIMRLVSFCAERGRIESNINIIRLKCVCD